VIRRFTVALAIGASLALGGCDSMPGRPRPAAREVRPEQVTAFDVLYRQNCAGCHGADGRLGAALALNDPVYLALVPVERLRTVITDGVPGTAMPGFGGAASGQLTAEQIESLVNGLRARWARPEAVKDLALPPYDAASMNGGSPAHPERGAAVYAAACARCHGAQGRGGEGASGGAIVDPTFLALVSDQHLRTIVIVGRPDLEKPDWRGDIPGQPLTAQQVSDLVAWLASHRQPVPGRPALRSDRTGA
jgi:mono/diheme cytochrome c family protein